MTWCIAFPYCPNEPIRAEAYELVSAFYRKHFPEVPQLTHSATAVGDKFLRAKTRNQLVNMATDQGFNIVALIDADTLVDPGTLARMVTATETRGMFLGKPFARGVNLPIDQQRDLAAGSIPWPRSRFNDPGAAWVIRPESWWAAGGMDEAIISWGGEDSMFQYLFAALGGETLHGQIAAVKTEHAQPRWSADPDWTSTLKRELVTKAIWHDYPQLASEWLRVRHEPGIVDEWVTRLQVPLSRRHFPVTP